MWPLLTQFTQKIVSEKVEPAIKSVVDGMLFTSLGGFQFEKVILGTVPPRITGIKIYEKTMDRDEMIADVDLKFESGCAIEVSMMSTTSEIRDFSFSGVLRVVLKPLLYQVPLIGGLQVFFLKPPKVDFDLGGRTCQVRILFFFAPYQPNPHPSYYAFAIYVRN